ncbi:hypothetical protein Lalb_Chr24g0399121 [Lupinus albus]|uniref:Uncharacterized protein n=1 Tax=Lupinus albus TaxID=3870 RepID=A0A6A4N928_LUPAL|nr:hypothetical protein Lalb_Chr24g0399121 [Lupinus albus]
MLSCPVRLQFEQNIALSFVFPRPLIFPPVCIVRPTIFVLSSLVLVMAFTRSSCINVAYTQFNIGRGSVARRFERVVPYSTSSNPIKN